MSHESNSTATFPPTASSQHNRPRGVPDLDFDDDLPADAPETRSGRARPLLVAGIALLTGVLVLRGIRDRAARTSSRAHTAQRQELVRKTKHGLEILRELTPAKSLVAAGGYNALRRWQKNRCSH
jgi:hypothetical protein